MLCIIRLAGVAVMLKQLSGEEVFGEGYLDNFMFWNTRIVNYTRIALVVALTCDRPRQTFIER